MVKFFVLAFMQQRNAAMHIINMYPLHFVVSGSKDNLSGFSINTMSQYHMNYEYFRVP